MNKLYDLIIIGGGPAGLTAAIYARRANLSVLVIEEFADGGKLSKISKIDNYPGFTSISGFELANNLIEQAKSYNTEILNDRVIKIDKDLNVSLLNNDILKAKTVLIATGSKQRKLDIPNASEFEGKGISYCATCDGFFFRNKDVVVIGSSNQALNETLYLANLASKVTIVNKFDDIIDETSLKDLINKNEKIEVINKAIPTNLIIENNKIVALQIIDSSNTSRIIKCSGIFPYISFNPSTDFIDNQILDDDGFVITNNDMSTSIPGIYAAGDCIKKDLRQVVTACSDGAVAATSIIKYLKNKA